MEQAVNEKQAVGY
jgi:hypothetical protein